MPFKNYRRKEDPIVEIDLLRGGSAFIREWGTPDFQEALLEFAKEHPKITDPKSEEEPTQDQEDVGMLWIAKNYLIAKLVDADELDEDGNVVNPGEVFEGEELEKILDDPGMWELINEIVAGSRVRANFLAEEEATLLGN